MWVKFNPNPKKLTVGDCTVRSICDMADMPSADRVWWALLEQMGFARKKMIDRCPECYTVEQFAFDHPRGIYILGPHEHAVALIDGNWWDSWDSGLTVPTYYFRRL